MGIHSGEESCFIAYFLACFGRPCQPGDIFECQRLGDRHHLIDAVVNLPCDGQVISVGIEYDGGHWHTADRIQHDFDKTEKVLRAYPHMILVRVRQGSAPPLPQVDTVLAPRCVMVQSLTSNPARIMQDVAQHLSNLTPALPEALQSSMIRVARGPPIRCPTADAAGEEVRRITREWYNECYTVGYTIKSSESGSSASIK